HVRLDQLSDEEFFDWTTYGTVYDERERRWVHERLLSQPPETTDPYATIEQELNEQFGPVEGIPGCYIDNDYLRLKTFSPHRLIVPCRIHSTMRALQIYNYDGSDFYWHSTPGARSGAKARASIHIANESLAALEGRAIIVSHTLEADSLAWAERKCVIAINGLSSSRVRRELHAALPDLKRVAVPSRLGLLARTLQENGYLVLTFDE
ncbi:MAG: hypothetical protein WCB68_24485, partial [Pyrinomonadaceae bacterium]